MAQLLITTPSPRRNYHASGDLQVLTAVGKPVPALLVLAEDFSLGFLVAVHWPRGKINMTVIALLAHLLILIFFYILQTMGIG